MEKFEKAELVVVSFDACDVICSSEIGCTEEDQGGGCIIKCPIEW